MDQRSSEVMAFWGSAGILPAAVGMLPAAFVLTAIVSANKSPRALPRLKAVRQNAGQSGQNARAPQPLTF
jgi:hypothetical protein